MAEGGARRCSRQGDPVAGDGQPQPQRLTSRPGSTSPADRDRGRPGAGRRWCSAFLFDRPEENRAMQNPGSGAARDDPELRGRDPRLPFADRLARSGLDVADALFGDSGVLVLELNAAGRDPATNRAPISVRLIPLIEDLSLEATDGTLLRRSRPALFRGLGRRPRGGGPLGGRPRRAPASPNPSGGDPYTLFPPVPVPGGGLRGADLARVHVHLLGPRHRRFRPSGPGLDQPPQALSGQQRQGRHRHLFGAAVPVQRRHERR